MPFGCFWWSNDFLNKQHCMFVKVNELTVMPSFCLAHLNAAANLLAVAVSAGNQLS